MISPATYNAQNANSIEAAYIRDAKSIYALTHAFRGFCEGVTACAANPDGLIEDQREYTTERQEEIQARMSGMYYDLLDVDPARAHSLPAIPRTVVEVEKTRRSHSTDPL